jgi:hypothetical protein
MFPRFPRLSTRNPKTNRTNAQSTINTAKKVSKPALEQHQEVRTRSLAPETRSVEVEVEVVSPVDSASRRAVVVLEWVVVSIQEIRTICSREFDNGCLGWWRVGKPFES